MLISSSGDIKLTDFGSMRSITARSLKTETVVGTVAYLAPECVQGIYSPGSDIWALGCSVIEMITGMHPWHRHPQATDQISLIFLIGNLYPPTHYPPMPQAMSPACRDFLNCCFEFDYRARPSAAALLNHPLSARFNLFPRKIRLSFASFGSESNARLGGGLGRNGSCCRWQWIARSFFSQCSV